jgi:transposase
MCPVESVRSAGRI